MREKVSIHYDDSTATQALADPARRPSETRELEFERFLEHAARLREAGQDPDSLRTWLELAEAWRITQALRECKGNRSAAARKLGIGRRTLYAKMDKLGIAPTWSF
jgi:DNA-binding NtrC family response regulator